MTGAKLFLTRLFYSLTIAILLLSCTKNKGPSNQKLNSQSKVTAACGLIAMTPQKALYPNMSVSFEVLLPDGVTASNLEWNFKKQSTSILTTSSNPVAHTFNGSLEGSGSYSVSVNFQKSDGNSCALEQKFQILKDDVCVIPSGISGPTIGYVGEETSPFSLDAEDCFDSTVVWDMDSDGALEYSVPTSKQVVHTYSQTGTYTVTATVAATIDQAEMVFTHTIEIKNKVCINPFTNATVQHGQSVEFAKPDIQCGSKPCLKENRICSNGVFEGDISYTENPAMCAVSIACPASYIWEASQFGACTGPCEEANGTKSITDYICKKSSGGTTTTAPDSECSSNIGAKPSGQTQTCTVPISDQELNCLACGSTPHEGIKKKWATNAKCGESCTVENRVCNNGVLPPFDPGYIYDDVSSCPITECPPVYTYSWKVGDYSACSATTCGTQGTQTRTVICTRNDGVAVADSNCTSPKPVTSKVCSAIACTNCNFNGQTVKHGTSVTAYQVSSVACGLTCSSQTRTCDNGVLSGTYTSATCSALACSYTWKTTSWSACSATTCGTQGTQTRTVVCKRNDGVTVADSNCTSPKPVTSKVCSAIACTNCNFNGQTVKHGTSVTAYQASSVACGLTCSSQARTCNNGVLSGTYTASTCSALVCSYTWKTTPWGACSATACGTQGVQKRSVTCTRNDGLAVADSYCSGTKPNDTKACSARPCYACKLPWGEDLSHGSSVTAFQAPSVACGLTCSSEQRSCHDGVLSGSYSNKTCSVVTCPTPVMTGSSCYAFMGTMISWKDSSTGATCIGNLFNTVMVGDYMQIGGTHLTQTNEIIPWDKATYRGSAKVTCSTTPGPNGLLPFKVESGTCKPGEPNLITTPVISNSAPSDCKASPVVQQPFGSGKSCAVYRQGTFGDMPLKGTFLSTGVKKYVTMGDFTRGYEQTTSATQGKIFSSGSLKITYGGETKDLNTYCGDSTVTAPTNSVCAQSSSVVVGGVTFTMGVGARNTIDPVGYVPEYISSFKNTGHKTVWSQKTCGVVTLSSSLGYLPPPCP